MSTMQADELHAGVQGPRSAALPGTDGVGEGTHHLTFYRTGHLGVIGRGVFSTTEKSTPSERGVVLWTSFNTSLFQLSRPAFLHVLQGGALHMLFDEACWAQHVEKRTYGPFYPLFWTDQALLLSSGRLQRLVLAKAQEPRSISHEDLFQLIVGQSVRQSLVPKSTTPSSF